MNSKEKAVEILNSIDRQCTYDKENNDIKIWDNPSNKINLFFKGDIYGKN